MVLLNKLWYTDEMDYKNNDTEEKSLTLMLFICWVKKKVSYLCLKKYTHLAIIQGLLVSEKSHLK